MPHATDSLSEAPLLLSPNKVAEMLSISRGSVYRLINTGELDGIKIKLSSATGNSGTRITNESVRTLIQKWMAV
jgi:biotin operon repressor